MEGSGEGIATWGGGEDGGGRGTKTKRFRSGSANRFEVINFWE